MTDRRVHILGPDGRSLCGRENRHVDPEQYAALCARFGVRLKCKVCAERERLEKGEGNG